MRRPHVFGPGVRMHTLADRVNARHYATDRSREGQSIAFPAKLTKTGAGTNRKILAGPERKKRKPPL